MKKIQCVYLLVACLGMMSNFALAESMRCHGDIVDIGDTKADILQKCGKPEITDTFCEKSIKRVMRSDGLVISREDCENVDVWTYNPGKGQFWTHLYFAQGALTRDEIW